MFLLSNDYRLTITRYGEITAFIQSQFKRVYEVLNTDYDRYSEIVFTIPQDERFCEEIQITFSQLLEKSSDGTFVYRDCAMCDCNAPSGSRKAKEIRAARKKTQHNRLYCGVCKTIRYITLLPVCAKMFL